MKKLVIKNWLFQKIAKENHAPHVWSDCVMAIVSETEKAYKVLMGSVSFSVFVWVPKSQCEWAEANNEFDATRICESFEEAVEYKNWLKSCFC